MNSILKQSSHRFNGGWDRVENIENTFAGLGCSKETFGHLGFTGTSIWIDTNKKLGHVILANATKHYWFDKFEFNKLRKNIAQQVWS
jgi:CubicO group peptidase (beta-lactamase class C family)